MKNTEYIKCYLSELGHNNFFYPSTTTALITAGCKYDVLSWVGGAGELKPIKLLKSCVLPLKSKNAAGVIQNYSSNKHDYTVVWIPR